MSAQYAVTPEVVWSEMRHIERHVNWMHDAVRIEFTSEVREGVGTQFVCDTKVGPFRTRDLMAITEWAEDAAMGVNHRGLITGEGRFTLNPSPLGTTITWRETLHFPWWMGGEVGAKVAKPVLRLIWQRNLRLLGSILEA